MFYTSMDSVVSVCLCACLREFGTLIVSKKKTQRSFLWLYNKDWNSHFCFFTRHTSFINKLQAKWLKDYNQIEIDKGITLFSSSYVLQMSLHWYRFALYNSSSPTVNVIYLPLHVEKLLMLCHGNVVGYCQSICYVGFLTCCCVVALCSLSVYVHQCTPVTFTMIKADTSAAVLFLFYVS